MNFRRPRQHELAGVANFHGLVNVLEEDAPWAAAVHQVEDLPLYVLPTGECAEAHPELLEGQAFRALLGEVETEYDLVVIDAPPALLTSDSQLLAKQVDAIAIVVRAGRDPRGMVERMLRRLDGQRADVLGVVLNGVRSAAGGYFRKSYEEFYNYRKEEDKGAGRNGRAASERIKERSRLASGGAGAAGAGVAADALDGPATEEEQRRLPDQSPALAFADDPDDHLGDEPGIDESFELGLDEPERRD